MRVIALVLAVFVLAGLALAQAADNKMPAAPADDISGMYSFLREGEYIQLNVEEQGKITGVVSRFGDLESDRGVFLDQFFEKASLDKDRLTFTTRPLHGVWYEFAGKVVRATDKTPSDEGYRVLQGKLTQYLTDASKTVSAKTREVQFKSFPSDVSAPGTKKD